MCLFWSTDIDNSNLPKLPRWNQRYCQLCIEPTEEQLTNKDNIYGLIWRTRHLLQTFGYTDNTIKYYDQSGFSKLLVAHRDVGTETYSPKLCAKLVLATHNLVESGKLYKNQAIRKTAALLHEFHKYGSITPATLSPFKEVLLTPIFESLVEEYGNDAVFSGKLQENTARTAKSIIKSFLLNLEKSGYYSFDEVTLSTIGKAITETSSNQYKHSADSLLHYVREFLKYLFEYNLIEADLSVAVPKMAATFKKIYQGFTDEEIIKIISAVDRDTLIGKRDYAIMVLAVQTGLRAIDITQLKLGDIDWRKNEINVIQSKTKEPICVTLEPESGNAICDYILNARQKCDLPNVFLSDNYPLRALCRQTQQGIIKKYMSIAGIETTPQQRYGFHSFRRAFGTRLLENGTPIHLLSQLLGHIKLESSKPYLSISEKGLKDCCLPLTFGESKGYAI